MTPAPAAESITHQPYPIMRWLYRLQQRLALTPSEAHVLLTFTLLFGLGLGVRHVQQQARPLPPADYAEAMQSFHEASAALPAPAAALSEETPATPATPRKTYRPKALPTAPIDLNTATSAELQRLPRIGPKMAQRILEYRAQHGAFRRVQDLTRVRGIGAKTLAKLAPYLAVEES